MHLAIDVREACRPRPTGKGHWTRGFVDALRARGVDVTLVTDLPPPPEWRDMRVMRIVEKGWRWHLRAAKKIPAIRADAYVSTVSYIVPCLLPADARVVTVVHDLIAFGDGSHDRRAALIERLTLKRAATRSSLLLTPSDATRDALLARFPTLDPRRAATVYAGLSRDVPGGEREDDGRTVLCIGTLCPRKNQERLIRAFAALPEGLRAGKRLILVGMRGWKDDAIVRLAKETLGVEWRDYVPDVVCEELLRTCAVFALPSLNEGFGMPVLDALARGVPTLTSDRGSLKEVAGDAAVIVDPERVDAIAAGLSRLLRDPVLRQSLSDAGLRRAPMFSWDRTAELFLDAMARVDKLPAPRQR
jgi:glycosyltransferase involved in cell wall biosynthesis